MKGMKNKRVYYLAATIVLGFAGAVFLLTSDPEVLIIKPYTPPEQLRKTGLLNPFSIWCLRGWVSLKEEDTVVVIYPFGFYRKVDGRPRVIESW